MAADSRVTFLLRRHVRARSARRRGAAADRAQSAAHCAPGTPHLPVGALSHLVRSFAGSTSVADSAASGPGAAHRGGSAFRLGSPARLGCSGLRGRATRLAATGSRGADRLEQRVPGGARGCRRDQPASRYESVQVLHSSFSVALRKSGPRFVQRRRLTAVLSSELLMSPR